MVSSNSRNHSTIKGLQAAFRDPSSPFHIPPGTQGPAHPDDHEYSTSTVADPSPENVAQEARNTLLKLGFDPESFWEQQIVWGDHDSFQHVNNVRYVRFFESGRIKWMTSLAHEIGGQEKVEAMLKGKGFSLILKSLSINYKRPVTYPDTLLIAHKPYVGPLATSSHTEDKTLALPSAKKLPKTHFNVIAAAYSYAQQKIVTESDSVLVWYDYDKLRKCDPGPEVRAVLERRMAFGK